VSSTDSLNWLAAGVPVTQVIEEDPEAQLDAVDACREYVLLVITDVYIEAGLIISELLPWIKLPKSTPDTEFAVLSTTLRAI
jgi:hypothetical protein